MYLKMMNEHENEAVGNMIVTTNVGISALYTYTLTLLHGLWVFQHDCDN